MQAAKVLFATFYQPGGRLYTGTLCKLSTAEGFNDFVVPRAVMCDVLRMLYSHETARWLRSTDSVQDVRDVSRGFRSQVTENGTGKTNLYSGSMVVQFGKTLRFVLQSVGNLATEESSGEACAVHCARGDDAPQEVSGAGAD
eukprot:1059415-Prymnesium_polylepis.3